MNVKINIDIINSHIYINTRIIISINMTIHINIKVMLLYI
jgi:hypothetical protein